MFRAVGSLFGWNRIGIKSLVAFQNGLTKLLLHGFGMSHELWKNENYTIKSRINLSKRTTRLDKTNKKKVKNKEQWRKKKRDSWTEEAGHAFHFWNGELYPFTVEGALLSARRSKRSLKAKFTVRALRFVPFSLSSRLGAKTTKNCRHFVVL